MPFISTKKILVVDDEVQNLALMNQTLKDDYHLVFAKSGEEALNMVQKHKPDLILLDISMPGISGYEVCRQLRSNHSFKDIPIIFLTSHVEADHELCALTLGADDFIRKPLQPIIFKLRIHNILSLIRLERLEKSHVAAIQMLGEAGHYNDTDTGMHIWRMAAYSAALAKAVGLSEPEIELIRLAAPMHDTGKIGIPDHILKKPGKFDADEWKIMKEHSNIGFSILSKSKEPLFVAAATIAKHHHEKWDGSGYPDGLIGKDIPLSARIVAIADVFDALTTKRPYKEPWTFEESLQYVAAYMGSHFDPELAHAFIAIKDELLIIRDKYAD